MNKMKSKSIVPIIGFALTLTVAQQSLLAQSNSFINATPDSDYATAGNWSLNVVPTGGDTVAIGDSFTTRSAVYSSATDFSTTGRILIGRTSGASGSLTMNSGSGILTFGGNASNASNFIGVDAGIGLLKMNGGTFRVIGSTGDGFLRIGANTGMGTATINAGLLDIGHSANVGARFDNGSANSSSIGILTVAGTGQVIVGSGSNSTTTGGNNGYLYLKNDAAGSSGSATVNLNGGSLTAKRIVAGTGGGTKTVNFNGGTLIAGASDANFLDAASGFTANVQNGGAVINTQAFNVGIGAALVANGSGGLTKTGSGELTLSNANTYTGATTISAGTLVLSSAGSIASTQIGFGVTNASSGLLTVQNTLFAFTGTLNLDLQSVSATAGSWTLFNGSAFGSGDLSLAALTSNLSGLNFTNGGGVWSGTDTNSRIWTFNQTTGLLTAAIPEPSTYAALAGLFVIGLAAVRRRR